MLLKNCFVLNYLFPEYGMKTKSGLLVVLMNVIYSTSFFVPLINCLLASLLLPPYTGYLILKLLNEVFCSNCSIHVLATSYSPMEWSSFIRFFSGTFAFVSLNSATNSTVLIAINEVLIGVLTIHNFLQCILGGLAQATKTSSNIKKLTELRLMVQLYNDLYQNLVYSYGFAIADIVIIVFGYCAVKLWTKVSVLGVVIFVLIVIAGLVVIFISYTAAGTVWVGSESFIQRLKYDFRMQKNPLFRKQVASIAPLKIKIGSVNFVDRATAGVYLSFTVQQIGSLTMLNIKAV
jgi:hypothetical protein